MRGLLIVSYLTVIDFEQLPTLANLDGRALSYSVGQMDLLFDVLMQFEELAWKDDVTLCDPQDGSLRQPRNE